MSSDFCSWLNKKLRDLSIDESVFGTYITGILEGDETDDEKREALDGVLQGAITEEDIEKVVSEIIDKWDQNRPKESNEKKEMEDVDAKLARLMENKHITTNVQREYTPEELRIRQQILSQYSTVEFEDEYGEDDDAAGASGTSGAAGDNPLLEKNTNFQNVVQLQKERREQARLDSKAKKDKDKEDREKQKQLREEKKEKRKTVKGERRR